MNMAGRNEAVDNIFSLGVQELKHIKVQGIRIKGTGQDISLTPRTW